jgi:hypothetical protein
MKMPFNSGIKPRSSAMSNFRVLSKSKLYWLAMVLAGVSGLNTLSCRNSNEAGTLYLRSCETGRLVGPIQMSSGQALPALDEKAYIIADPTESELELRAILLESTGYESVYLDFHIDDTIETIQQMLRHRIGGKAPFIRVEDVDALITTKISAEESAYDVLFKIAAKAKARICIEDGTVVLSRNELAELTRPNTTTNDMVARRERPSR